MIRRRLLERVLDSGREHHAGAEDRRKAIRQSILDSLQRIFGTGQGDASTDPLYGLPDVGGISRSMPETIEQMRDAIVRAITQYEPRLRDVQVIPATDEQGRTLRFHIVARVRDDDGGAINVTTRIEATGHLRVEE